MHAAKIIVREVQSASRFQVPELLRESVRQTGKTSHLHPHGQVLALDMRGTDSVGIGIAGSHFGYNLDDWAWGVFRICVMLPILTIELYQLREVHFGAECFLDVTAIEHVPIRC